MLVKWWLWATASGVKCILLVWYQSQPSWILSWWLNGTQSCSILFPALWWRIELLRPDSLQIYLVISTPEHFKHAEHSGLSMPFQAWTPWSGHPFDYPTRRLALTILEVEQRETDSGCNFSGILLFTKCTASFLRTCDIGNFCKAATLP